MASPAFSPTPLDLHSLLLENTILEPFAVDVKRLRDDSAPIQAGEEVMFVAVAHFRLLETGADPAEFNEAPGATLLTIRDDADLVSPMKITKESDVREWLAQNFDFTFTLNGQPVPKESLGIDGDPPWVFRLNTATQASDYVNVEADITPLTAPVPKPPVDELGSADLVKFVWKGRPVVLRLSVDPMTLDRAELDLEQELVWNLQRVHPEGVAKKDNLPSLKLSLSFVNEPDQK